VEREERLCERLTRCERGERRREGRVQEGIIRWVGGFS